MNVRYLLGIVLAAATAVAACGDGSTNSLSNGLDGDGQERPGGGTGGGDGNGGGGEGGGTLPAGEADPATTPSGPASTNSPAGQKFYVEKVHPFMVASCGACHNAAGPGQHYMTSADPQKSYAQLFQLGYVTRQSRITAKPAHGGITTNVLSAAQIGIYNQWVETELKDGGEKAPPNVLEKLGGCFSRKLFDAMQLGNWTTGKRTNNNNVNKVANWSEDGQNCTGPNRPCSTCHSGDPATNYVNASGNPVYTTDPTFESSKMTSPAYITKYFGVSAEGKPVASDAIKKKAEAAMKTARCSHPIFTLSDQQTKAMNAFIDDAISRYNAGTCGQ
jgi:hypothetical protein